MPLSLYFDASHRYASTDGIDVPTELRVGEQRVELIARLDTGAAYFIFERRYAEELGLDVESGRPQRFRTMAGSFMAYEHAVTLHTLGIEFSAIVFETEICDFRRDRARAACSAPPKKPRGPTRQRAFGFETEL